MSLANILTKSAELENANLVALGIDYAYDEPPEAIRRWPCSIRYAQTGSLEASKGDGRHNLHTFIIEVHFRRAREGGLESVQRLALPVVDAYQTLYAANLKLLGACDLIVFDSPAYEVRELDWGGDLTYGVRFWMVAKEKGAITVETGV